MAGICAKYTKPNWFPVDGVIKVSDNGSMEKPILTAAVSHVNTFVRQFVPSNEAYVLCLDGHSSRKGTEWVEECANNNCEAVLQPANTSHFLQPCDQSINKRFKTAMRELRDAFRHLGLVDTRQVNLNLACAVHAFECISASDVTDSFQATGIYPFIPDFASRFKSSEDELRAKAKEEHDKLSQGGPSSRMRSVRQRRSDLETFKEVENIMRSSNQPSKALQQLSILLKRAETVNNILMTSGPGTTGTAITGQSSNGKRFQTLDPGAPAECLTLQGVLERRRQRDAAEMQQNLAKEQRKMKRQLNLAQRAAREQERRDILAQEKEQKQQTREREAKRRCQQKATEREKKAADANARRCSAEVAKELARRAKERAAELGRSAAAACRAQQALGVHRGRKRDARGQHKRQAPVRSFQFAAALVLETLEAAMGERGSQAFVRN